ncbi:MAG: hypothetical protein QW505_03080 [Thermoplasmata archaeon]
MKLRISRRGLMLGVILGTCLTLSGIVVIQYTEAFYLVVILWVALPVILVQFVRWIRNKFGRQTQ